MDSSRTHRRVPPAQNSTAQAIQNTYAPGAYDEVVNADMDPPWDSMATDYNHFGQNGYGSLMGYPNLQNPAAYAMPAQIGRPESPSTTMVRRNQQQQLARARAGQLREYDGVQGNDAHDVTAETEEEALARARKVKDEAQAQRKSLVPFVQKLLSFLQTSEWIQLIHWTKDGKAFVITDDEAFAKDVIPRMFKHNNYPSFVRQLNMYGFHKRVGLDEGSFHANEHGVRMPHTYEHKYFQRDKPELAWLISKPPPKSMTTGKRDTKRKRLATDADVDASEDDVEDGMPKDDNISIPRSEIVGMRKDLSEYRQSSQTISMVIAELRENKNLNKALSQRVLHLEEQNRKQAHVLNSILQFLQLYAKKDTAPNLTQTQGYGPISPRQNNSTMPGQVVNLEDMNIADIGAALMRANPGASAGARGRRPFALLPPPEATNDFGIGSVPASADAATSSHFQNAPANNANNANSLFGNPDGIAAFNNITAAPSPPSPQTVVDSTSPSMRPSSPLTMNGSTPRVPSDPPRPSQPMTTAAHPSTATSERTSVSSRSTQQPQQARNQIQQTQEQRQPAQPIASTASRASPPANLPFRAPSPLFELGNLPPTEQFTQLSSHLDNQDERVRHLLSRVGSYSPGGRLNGIQGWEGGGTTPTSASGANPAVDDDLSRWLVDGHGPDGADYFGSGIGDVGIGDHGKELEMDFDLSAMDTGDGEELFGDVDGEGGKVVGSVESSVNSPADAAV
ncbi:hypothetical protein P152DRAFT_311795 [Eremomyces bilateralis CBS 781.70]|uniref:HSF-type DNA-binding domain-containing protein n=1 Tax=Eremomyces bilateralis CBS 781.70 TaxID=1392243 RepID=A0A6G1G5J0_9PEZI|nr:uncharacterized protein P152DRAFT_311795 [Eremomyces bilateralis CBS 781.70]KAF1813272.1 hypothetical protein P152DRAFT_311795 [Eremomyces bilateralis CBS 781.70]